MWLNTVDDICIATENLRDGISRSFPDEKIPIIRSSNYVIGIIPKKVCLFDIRRCIAVTHKAILVVFCRSPPKLIELHHKLIMQLITLQKESQSKKSLRSYPAFCEVFNNSIHKHLIAMYKFT